MVSATLKHFKPEWYWNILKHHASNLMAFHWSIASKDTSPGRALPSSTPSAAIDEPEKEQIPESGIFTVFDPICLVSFVFFLWFSPRVFWIHEFAGCLYTTVPGSTSNSRVLCPGRHLGPCEGQGPYHGQPEAWCDHQLQSRESRKQYPGQGRLLTERCWTVNVYVYLDMYIIVRVYIYIRVYTYTCLGAMPC